ncbi:phytoene desaturase family protein [Chloroflexota bacterium]
MPGRYEYDAVVVGSGPNGLAAAITLAQEGFSVLVLEATQSIGGGMRSGEITLPGYVHDICSAIHPLAVASPFFKKHNLFQEGLEWIYPPAAVAHPLDDGTALLLERSIEATGETLGSDSGSYHDLMTSLVRNWDKLVHDVLGPLRFPRHPLVFMRFGLKARLSAKSLAASCYKAERARNLFAGIAAHSILPFETLGSAAIGLILGAAGHAVGWPIAKGGSQKIADAMSARLLALGGEITTEVTVRSMEDIPAARAVIFDVTPKQLAQIAGHRFPVEYHRRLEQHLPGPGVFKMDWALDGPIPWKSEQCARAGTVHIGGTFDEIAEAERVVGQGEHPHKPFIILAQQSLFDSTRAPAGKHTSWAYCHVPNGSTIDMSDRIESQIERFAPGFRDIVLARSCMSPMDMEAYNANYIGGDIVGGIQSFSRLFVRPLGRFSAYSTPSRGIYICSSSMPPGAGVHGMCGYYAARAARRELS